MASIIQTLGDFISYLNTLYESDSTAPSSGDEDYLVWTSLANIAINLWENEEGILWSELFAKLVDATDGTKTITAGTYSYACPTNFIFSASGFVRLTSSTGVKTFYRVIKPQEVQLLANDGGEWCYFLGNISGGYTLNFNPNLTLNTGDTITYEYYKAATKLSASTDKFEMSDPMFAVYYALSELKKEEGDTTSLSIATQKLEGMKTKNIMPAWFQSDANTNQTEDGFGK